MLNYLAYNYHWVPCAIGAIWMYIVCCRDPLSRSKELILYQFLIVIGLSAVFDEICKGRSSEWVISQCWWMLSLSTALQMPVAFILGFKYPDSNRGIIVIIATLFTTVVNALLYIDTTYGANLIKFAYNESLFILNVLAIGSCNRAISDGVSWLVFGNSDSRRSRLRRRCASWAINQNKKGAA